MSVRGCTLCDWSETRVEQLKKLWESGLSASQIAAELGNITRNAVIGKVHRLGLSGRTKVSSAASPRPRKVRAEKMTRVSRPMSRGNTALAQMFEAEVETDSIAYDNVIPITQRCSIEDLSEAKCHWPVGDPVDPATKADFFYCGGKTVHMRRHNRVSGTTKTVLSSYCAHHSRMAYQPPTPDGTPRRRIKIVSAQEAHFNPI